MSSRYKLLPKVQGKEERKPNINYILVSMTVGGRKYLLLAGA